MNRFLVVSCMAVACFSGAASSHGQGASMTTMEGMAPAAASPAASPKPKGDAKPAEPAKPAAPKPQDAKPETKPAASPTPQPEAHVVETGIPASDFVSIVQPTLGKGEQVKSVDKTRVTVTAPKATVERIEKLALQLREGTERPARKLQMRLVLLGDEASADLAGRVIEDEESTATKVAPRETPAPVDAKAATALLATLGIKPGDFDTVPLPTRMVRLATAQLPTGGGETRMALSDRLTLIHDARPESSGDIDLRLTLAARSATQSVFDTSSIGRVLLTHRFNIRAGQPTLVGLTSPARTLVLGIRIDDK